MKYFSISHFCSQYVDLFVFELAGEEKDASKRKKLLELTMSQQEWVNIKEFHDVLVVYPFSVI